ncbi:hypothetical protein Cni_G23647 [Canna indica]|uniref:Uncharacterized protein n=1 Tax=Canna indica TaxID=4628 RepID=A0AAQ3QMP7_9LILI|nr:hypothetical protein Cni_G23647 [Canna indica]
MVMDSSFISRLTEILRTSSPSLQVKDASVLEYLVTLEANAAAATSAGIELALDVVFRKGSTSAHNMDNHLEQYAVQVEEISLATAAASRLLAKMLDFNEFYQRIDAAYFILLLRNILKSSIILLGTKDWVATYMPSKAPVQVLMRWK